MKFCKGLTVRPKVSYYMGDMMLRLYWLGLTFSSVAMVKMDSNGPNIVRKVGQIQCTEKSVRDHKNISEDIVVKI